jgi:uncharacterized protein YbaR (Trm112 family)
VHILLTDILACPRCGPGFGLILLADRVEARRVLAGVLGCANCRERYTVVDGGVHLGAVPGLPAPDGDDEESLMRLAAMLGVTHGPGFVLLVGPAAGHAPALSALLEDVEVVAAAWDVPVTPSPDRNGLSVLGFNGARIPVAGHRALGVALTGAAAALVEEGARVMAVTGRLVLDPAPPDAEERLAAAGLRVLARQGSTVVAGRVG